MVFMKYLRRHHISLINALNGIHYAFTSQPNFRIHGIISILVISTGIIFHITNLEMTILILAIVFGFGAEMINTSIESMTDLITTEYKVQAKIAKDVSAGMMLLIAIGTSILGMIILVPRILSLLI